MGDFYYSCFCLFRLVFVFFLSNKDTNQNWFIWLLFDGDVFVIVASEIHNDYIFQWTNWKTFDKKICNSANNMSLYCHLK